MTTAVQDLYRQHHRRQHWWRWFLKLIVREYRTNTHTYWFLLGSPWVVSLVNPIRLERRRK